MIRSIAVVQRTVAEASLHEAGVALIAIATPGCAVAAPPGLRALHVSFDTLAAELEAASLRLPDAAPARPFAPEHARDIADFVEQLQQDREPFVLLVCESEGLVRSVTVARWAAQRVDRPLHEGPAARVASCALTSGVLQDTAPMPRPWRNSRRTLAAAPSTMCG
jgi:predicted protein tyrosine phosphatase